MNPYHAYQQQSYSAWLRIDMLLALYDGTIAKLEAARAALVGNDSQQARARLQRARLLVGGLVSGVNPAYADMASQFLRLYEFVNHAIGVGNVESVEGALKVLRTLREGLETIRPEAAELERSGRIPPAGTVAGVQLTV